MDQQQPSAPRRNIPVFRNDPILVLIHGFITCGLYLIYWNIKTAEVINAMVGREAIPLLVAIVSGCCFPINIFLYYLVGENLDEISKIVGDQSLRDKSLLLIILGIFAPMVSAMIVQAELNKVYDRP